MTKVKTIDINAKEWFDRVNGNSYFSAEVIINYGTDSAQSFIIPFQYGYGDHYRHVAFEELVKRGYLSADLSKPVSLWMYYEENNIIVRHSKQENCRKRDLHK